MMDPNQSTKILVSLTDPRFGGPQRSSLEVAELLEDDGIETEFLIPDGRGEFARIAKERGFTVHALDLNRLHPPRKLFSNIKYINNFLDNVDKICGVIEDNNIDIVNARMTINFQAAISTIMSDSRLVWHFNDVGVPRPIAYLCSFLAQEYADEIVVSADNVVDYYFNDDVEKTKIYPTVNVNKFESKADQHSPLSEINGGGDIILGLVGNINPIKGYDTFIDAFSQVTKNHDNLLSVIAGRKLSTQKAYYQKLNRKIEKNSLNDSVHFIGWIENIREFFSSIDVFVMPSHSETGPMTLMEAMVMKKPIVTTNVGVVPEQLTDGEHAWIVEPRNANQLASAIDTALNKKKMWGDLGSNARELAIDEFSLEAAADKYVQVYRNIEN